MKQVFWIFVFISAFGAATFAQTEQLPCPTSEVTGGGVVRPGESMNFTVNVTDLSDTSNLKYEWAVSNGTISSGQGTPAIAVDTSGLLKTDITAKVKIEGFPANCANSGSESGAVFTGGHRWRFDEFGKLSNNDIVARIQNLYVELGSNPAGHGYIFNYGTENEIVVRAKQIQRAIKRLKLDSARVTIITGGANQRETGIYTKIWVMPKGTDMSPFEN